MIVLDDYNREERESFLEGYIAALDGVLAQQEGWTRTKEDVLTQRSSAIAARNSNKN